MKAPGQWWDATISPLSGCTSAGAGCDHCHSITRMKRHLPMLRGKGNAHVSPHTVLLHPERLAKIGKWRKPRVVLTPMLGDYFHPDVPDEFLDLAFSAMLASPLHTYYVLTKRPKRAAAYLNAMMSDAERVGPVIGEWGALPIILMASVWDQPSADAACSALSPLRRVRVGLHIEPMLGPIELSNVTGWETRAAVQMLGRSIDWLSWIVVGAENGPGARPMHPDWVRSLRGQCKAAGVPFYFKSWGAWFPADQPWTQDSPDSLRRGEQWLNRDGGQGFHGEEVWRMVKARTLGLSSPRTLDGQEYNETPFTGPARAGEE